MAAFWDVVAYSLVEEEGVLSRDYTVLHPRKLTSSYSLQKNIKYYRFRDIFVTSIMFSHIWTYKIPEIKLKIVLL
jgi:hypothetical protein